ncbi:MAG: DUF1573 domain-containing protein [Gemmataceae bacterium]|nr:DUF1573 domain-containing protein [Gemmataceae bacterium]MCI0739305.1 DUF1573 domain-containing protein [Gemmataceae bacterium]
MLRTSIVAILLFVPVETASAQWAEGMFDGLTKDFGSVPRGTVASHPFRLVNNTGAPVRIAGIRVTCGCTTARALKMDLEPGEESAILVQVDTRIFANSKNVTIYVRFSKPRVEEVRLWLQANSRDDVLFSADTLNFGAVQRGNVAQAEMNVSFFGDGHTRILDLKSESNYVLPQLKEIRRAGNEVVYQVSAKTRPDTPAGKWYSELWVTTNIPALTKLRIPVTMEVESPLSISPGTVALGEVKTGTESDRKVILRGIKPFRILRIFGTDPQVRVKETASDSKTVHILTVTLSPLEPGQLNRVLRVQTDLKTGGEIEFNAQAKVVP